MKEEAASDILIPNARGVMKVKTYHVLLDGTRLYRWNGGIDFLANLAAICYCIQQDSSKMRLKVSVMLPYKIPKYESGLRKLLGKESRQRNDTIDFVSDTVKRTNPNVEILYVRKYEIIKGSEDRAIRRLVKRHHVDCIVGVTSCIYNNLPVPWVSYIPDYQHKYLPQFFSQQNIEYRDELFTQIGKTAPYFIATSESHKSDLIKYSQILPEQIFTMPFAPVAPEAFWDTTCAEIQQYNLPKDFFIISNQFWKHKSHMTAVKALKLLHDQGYSDLQIVCTGQAKDTRDTEYIHQLKTLISELGLEQHFRILGLIPKLEQIELIKRARALIQPSLFEGDPGGCSTYDAVGLDRPVILSDTPVNLEAKVYEKAFFFTAEDEVRLAEEMKRLLELEHSPYSWADVQNKRKTNNGKLKNFFETMIIEICEGKK